jgi:hypothetical protein
MGKSGYGGHVTEGGYLIEKMKVTTFSGGSSFF